MRVSKSDWDAAIAEIKKAANYGGFDSAVFNASGGDMEHHQVKRGGKLVTIATGDAEGVYEIDDDVAEIVLKRAGRAL